MADLNDIPPELLCTVLFFALLAAIEFGHWLGRRFPADAWSGIGSSFLSMSSANTALLGLLLAFSFSMSLSRFEARKVAVLKEANAISVVATRSDFLQAEPRQKVRAMLRDYVDSRVAYHDVVAETAKAAQLFDEAKALQARIWAVVSMVENYRESSPSTQFSALSSAFTDMSVALNERRFAIENQIPSLVIVLLLLVMVQAAAMAGHAFGASRKRVWLALYGFPLVVSLVTYTILDLDRPSLGWVIIEQPSMLQLQASLR